MISEDYHYGPKLVKAVKQNYLVRVTLDGNLIKIITKAFPSAPCSLSVGVFTYPAFLLCLLLLK
jgi:hypothetical protein